MTKHTNNLLIEIGTEELPPKSLKLLAETFAEKLQQKLIAAEFKFTETKWFATPRRLAIYVEQLNTQQPDRSIEKRGPALKAAFDEHNKPTKALEGFLRSCNVELDKLEKLETAQGSWLVYCYQEKGKSIQELLPDLINQSLKELPIPKPMRWNNGDTQFVRPVHWIVMLYGKELIKGEILSINSDRKTYGHRFHHPEAIKLPDADSYQKLLKDQGKVIVDFAERKQIIREQITNIAKQQNSQAIIPEELLDEVTSLVELPNALLVNFDKEFLAVPREALISAMQDHQRCFALEKNNNLLPAFITVSNIASKDPQEVIRGNERVMRARLSDAKFFYDTDKKQKLSDRLEDLKNVVFQAKLGSLYDKSLRVAQLAKTICENKNAYRAGELCKTDLLTNMVGEFPELQGIMGYYYAKQDGENEKVALAIREHYQPRFAGDALPESLEGCAVALADRIDTLISIFGINQIPTGEKDPFGLRRAAAGIVKIIFEKELNLNLQTLLTSAEKNHQQTLPNPDASNQALSFIHERLPAWYSERKIALDVLHAVLAIKQSRSNLLDIHWRILAVIAFRQLPEAALLIDANKRVKNLLEKKAQSFIQTKAIDPHLFDTPEEKELFAALQSHKIREKAELFTGINEYTNLLFESAKLQPFVTNFLDNVKVLVTEDEKLLNNRLALLTELRQLFLLVADISLLQS